MTKRKNIILYCTDEQRFDLLGCMGHAGIQTPHVDALAADGAVFSNMYVQGTVCMPSRASILTGKYPCIHGITDNGFNLPESQTTIADILRDAGYHTACVGRTHVTCSMPHPVLPREDYHGFAECHHSQCYWEGLDPHGDYLSWIKEEHPGWYDSAAMPNPVNRDDAFGASWWDLPEELSMNAWITDVSLSVLKNGQEKNPDTPMFLWAGTWDPHPRYCAPSPWDKMYSPEVVPLPVRRDGELDDLPPHYRKLARLRWTGSKSHDLDEIIKNTLSVYWGMISHIDDQFGRLMRGIEALGMADDTIVIFTSDHGDLSGDHWCWGKGPYWFDGSLKIPFVIADGIGANHVDNRVLPNRRTNALAEEIDILPTILDLAGIDIPPAVQGLSLAPLLAGKTDTHREDVYSEYHDHNQSGDVMFSVATDRYRYVHYQNRLYGELYDFESDPNALYNRWDNPSYASVKSSMRDRLLNRLMANLERPDTRESKW